MNDTYEELVNIVRKAGILQSIGGLLEWDQQVMMPKGSIHKRSLQISTLSATIHNLATDKRIGELIEKVEQENLDDEKKAMVREIKWFYERSIKIPEVFIEEFSKLATKAFSVWEEAKKNDDYTVMRPLYEEIFSKSKEYANYIDPHKDPYQVLVQDYEPYLSIEEVNALLDEVKQAVIPLVRTQHPPTIEKAVPEDVQKQVLQHIAEKIGYSFKTGRLDLSTHPFTEGTRITTRLSEGWLAAITALIHESGHGMYEQGLREEFFGTPLGNSGSLSVHESQSRIWENNIARAKPFWNYFFSFVKQKYSLACTQNDILKNLNSPQQSLIRVDADELTYNLHIILRFEMEQELLRGTLSFEDAPRIWNEKMKSYLGITPQDFRTGILQDVHWAQGFIGYFPTYLIGSIIAAQLYAAAKKDIPGLEEKFAKGEFEPMHSWLKENIHIHGRRYPTKELIKRATGQDITAQYYIEYLKEKFKRSS